MKKSISVYSLLLFIVPVVTLTVCHQFHVAHTGIQTIPFIDGKVSVSLIGRQEYSIEIFKPAFFLYAFISVLFYFKISNLFLINGVKNKFKNHKIYINGGIRTIEDGNALLKFFDGFMIGRAAWDTPWMFSKIDKNSVSRLNVIDKYLGYAEEMSKLGYSKTIVLKPIFNLFHGMNGSKIWKQTLNSFSFEYGSLNKLYNLAVKIEKHQYT